MGGDFGVWGWMGALAFGAASVVLIHFGGQSCADGQPRNDANLNICGVLSLVGALLMMKLA